QGSPMKTLALVLPNLQQLTAQQEPKSNLSHTLQRGLTRADGKMTSLELNQAQEQHQQPLTQEVVSSALLNLRWLNSWRKVTMEHHPDQENTFIQTLHYQIPEGVTSRAIRDMLVDMIRPADKRLIVMLLGQLMAEKPFFDADQSVAKYRLQQ